MKKLWGGRFSKTTDTEVERFTSSLAEDARLWRVDIQGSMAHARQLGKQGLLLDNESDIIVKGLLEIAEDLEKNFDLDPRSEDIHSEIEKRLFAKVGPLAGKLHTGRSRNDQVATDVRLYLREGLGSLIQEIKSLQNWILDTAESHLYTLLPGLTHMQHAQPISLAHHLLAYFWMFERDCQRLQESVTRVNQMPLGSAALAGTSFSICRESVAEELKFSGLCENSLDAVSDRDFIIEFLSQASLIMMHLSRWADELILWSTPEFDFVQMDDSVTTGSSIMPQKKNPDVAELIRGRVGRVYGALMGALTMMKALPLSYHRDLQEDKTFLFEGYDTVISCVRLIHLILKTTEFRAKSMKTALQGDFSNATDLADHLVRQGLPFREAHEVVGVIVRFCLENKKTLEDLSFHELKGFCPLFHESILDEIQPLAVMQARKSRGGTSVEAVQKQILKARGHMEGAY